MNEGKLGSTSAMGTVSRYLCSTTMPVARLAETPRSLKGGVSDSCRALGLLLR